MPKFNIISKHCCANLDQPFAEKIHQEDASDFIKLTQKWTKTVRVDNGPKFKLFETDISYRLEKNVRNFAKIEKKFEQFFPSRLAQSLFFEIYFSI